MVLKVKLIYITAVKQKSGIRVNTTVIIMQLLIFLTSLYWGITITNQHVLHHDPSKNFSFLSVLKVLDRGRAS